MKSIYFTILIICNLFVAFTHAQDKKVTVQFVKNKAPKYADTEFITLEELYSINVEEFDEYYIYKLADMDVDSDTNLYVLDYFESTVTVFDKNGKYLRTFGGNGQGPGELERPLIISIYDDKISIYENFKGIKIWDLNGKYIDFILKSGDPIEIILPINNFYLLTVHKYLKRNIVEVTMCVDKYTQDLKLINNIVTIDNNSRKHSFFNPMSFIAINSKQHIYFPEKANEYKINKYDLDGNLLLSFGRDYKRIPFSKPVRDHVNKIRSQLPPSYDKVPLSKYPPVVRYIMIDNNDYVWVVVGEWIIDSQGTIPITSTIDIFNEHGEFLYTFKSSYLGYSSFIKNGRLYSTPTEDDLNIRVFKIHYKN